MKRDFAIPPIDLDRASRTALRKQIYQQVARPIRTGEIPNGTRLPSSRWLAKLLGVSRNTVLAAYDDLAADGLLLAVRGAGMRVSRGSPAPPLLAGLRHIIRDAGYPASVLTFEDRDGNPLYINF